MQNKNIKMFVRLLVPSIFGAVMYSLLTGLVAVLHEFSSLKQYLQIPGDVDFFRMLTSWLDRAITSHFGESVVATLVVGLFWALVGLVVYGLLVGLAGTFNDLSRGFDQRKYIRPRGMSRNQALVEAAQQAAVRLTGVVGLIFMVFGPLVRLVSGPPNNPATTAGWVVWFGLLWLALHACVVFGRFIALKPRLLG